MRGNEQSSFNLGDCSGRLQDCNERLWACIQVVSSLSFLSLYASRTLDNEHQNFLLYCCWKWHVALQLGFMWKRRFFCQCVFFWWLSKSEAVSKSKLLNRREIWTPVPLVCLGSSRQRWGKKFWEIKILEALRHLRPFSEMLAWYGKKTQPYLSFCHKLQCTGYIGKGDRLEKRNLGSYLLLGFWRCQESVVISQIYLDSLCGLIVAELCFCEDSRSQHNCGLDTFCWHSSTTWGFVSDPL